MKHDLTGRKFRMLTVVSEAHKAKDGHTRWLCRCDCGNETTVNSNHLLRPNGTASCGCVNTEHGEATKGKVSGLYRIWLTMRERCNNPKSQRYAYYGGRGITVCPEWDSYEQFKADMGEKPKGRSLDRKDNDGPYSKANCRWATPIEQGSNQRNNRWIEFNGEKKTLSEWARCFGRNTGSLHYGIKQHGVELFFNHLLRRTT